MLKRKSIGFYIWPFLVAVVFAVSCVESGSTKFRVDYMEFSQQKNDSLNIYFTSATSPLFFSGEIELIDGQCDILLVNPENDTVFNEAYFPGDGVTINEDFEPVNGDWKFKYRLTEYEDELPFGNLEFEFTYEN
ncbi:MAG: hypothetical protein K9G70_14035 [Prolixibacteraceae bacterium]|nr:hypothetical protein [Prolixibacteraceae bacterium]